MVKKQTVYDWDDRLSILKEAHTYGFAVTASKYEIDLETINRWQKKVDTSSPNSKYSLAITELRDEIKTLKKENRKIQTSINKKNNTIAKQTRIIHQLEHDNQALLDCIFYLIQAIIHNSQK